MWLFPKRRYRCLRKNVPSGISTPRRFLRPGALHPTSFFARSTNFGVKSGPKLFKTKKTFKKAHFKKTHIPKFQKKTQHLTPRRFLRPSTGALHPTYFFARNLNLRSKLAQKYQKKQSLHFFENFTLYFRKFHVLFENPISFLHQIFRSVCCFANTGTRILGPGAPEITSPR